MDDIISRQAAIDALRSAEKHGFDAYYNNAYYKGLVRAHKIIEDLPSVQPEKVGHWIEQEGYDGDVYYDCSACGNSWTTIDGTPWDNGMNYCPCCGAKMEEGE